MQTRRGMGSWVSRFRRSELGNSMVELALVMGLIFVPLMFGVFEYGRVVFAKSTVTAAAREGVRFAIVRGSTVPSRTTTQTAVSNYVQSVTALPVTTTATWEDVNKNPQTSVTVQVSYAYTSLVPFISSKTLTSASKQLIAY